MPDEPFLSRATVRAAIGAAGLSRFYSTLDRLGCAGQPLGLAVSGGPDSIALLLLGAAYELPGTLFVATVDHGLRPEAAAEAEDVGRLCDALAIPHATLKISLAGGGGGPQAAAREARYAALAEWCPGPWLLTAHHQDDVAETLLMRLRRGSGVRGLARMAASRPFATDGPTLLRPLLDWTKAELLAICAGAGIATIRDPSNSDPRHDRTAARALLAKTPWLDPVALARSAAHLSEADAALDWYARSLWGSNAIVQADRVDITVPTVPHDTKRRLVARALAALGGPAASRHLDDAVLRLDRGEHAMVGDISIAPGGVWRFRRAPPRRAV